MTTDYLQRFLFENLDIRGRLVCLGGAWQRMHEGRGYPDNIARLLGRTAGLCVLLGANQKGAQRVALQLTGSGPLTLLIADCTSELRLRGMAQYASSEAPTERALFGDGRLALTLTDTETGQAYQSLVPLVGDTLAGMFEHYLAQSEQLPAFLRLHASETAVCGMLLEKLPAADQRDADGWNRITQLAATLAPEEALAAEPAELLTRLFPGELLRAYRLRPVEYHCPRDEEKVRNVLRGLGRREVEAILAEKGEVVIRNEMCNHEYRFDRPAVEALFA